MGRFELTKWYIDCVDPDGRVAIAYWASLTWAGLAVTWQSLAIDGGDVPALQRSAAGGGAAPVVAGGTLTWQPDALECVIVAESRQPAIDVPLLADEEAPAIEWRCGVPAAAVAIDAKGVAPMRGTGYAERLVLRRPPWRLPIRELRWGRWMTADATRSLVWIDWRGEAPRTWLFVDGKALDGASIEDGLVRGDGVALALDCRRTLKTRAFADVAGSIPGLAALVPALRWRDTRWVSGGCLEAADAAIDGAAIHELVVFG